MRKIKDYLPALLVLFALSIVVIIGCDKDENGDDPDAVNIPTVSTIAASAITNSSASCGGNITADNGAPVTARGVCWSTNQTPNVSDERTVDGLGVGSFTSNITGLQPNTTYYVRAYATNSTGNGYGNEISFVAGQGVADLIDIDGNTYSTITLGNQIWMAENLKVTHYSDGTPLVDGTGVGSTNGDNTTKYFFWYEDDISNKNTYGALYTWAAIMNSYPGTKNNPGSIQGVCPAGWHIPSDNEWKELELFLGMSEDEIDLTDWRGTNEGSKLAGQASLWSDGALVNEAEFGSSGFQALPAGYRYDAGLFYGLNDKTMFWSTAYTANDLAMIRNFRFEHADLRRVLNSTNDGFSVRCVKD